MKVALAVLLATISFTSAAEKSWARGRAATRGGGGASHRSPGPWTTGRGARVAVQPFEGPGGDGVRALIARIVRGRGFRAVTSLPRYEGTAQYPSLAKDHRLAALVTGDVDCQGRAAALPSSASGARGLHPSCGRGSWHTVTFLVWDGVSGSVLARWSAGARANQLPRAIGKGFWKHLGDAMLRASPPPDPLQEAPPMRIDASDDPVATRD